MKKILRTNDIKFDLIAVGCLFVLYLVVVLIDLFLNNPFKRKTTFIRKRICNWTVVGVIKAAQMMTIWVLTMIAYSEHGNSAIDTTQTEFDVIHAISMFILPISCLIYGPILERTGARLYLFINTLLQSITCFVFGTILLKLPHSYQGEIFLYFFHFLVVFLTGATEISMDKINSSWYRSPKERAVLAGILPILGIFNYIGAILTRYSYYSYVGSPSLLYACSLVLLTVSVFSFFIQNTPQPRDFVHKNSDKITPRIKEPTLLNASAYGIFVKRWFIYVFCLGMILYGCIGEYFSHWVHNIIISFYQVDIKGPIYILGSMSFNGIYVISCILFAIAFGFAYKYLFLFTFISFLIITASMIGILGLQYSTDTRFVIVCFILSFLMRFFSESILATKRYYSMVTGGYKWAARLSALLDASYYLGVAFSVVLIVLLRPNGDFELSMFNLFGVICALLGSCVYLFLFVYKTIAFKVYKIDFENKDRF